MSSEAPATQPVGSDAEPISRLRARLDEISWYHTQEVAPGLVTPGFFDLRDLVGHYGLPDDLTGKRCLDVGTFEGFWAFELERRGAQVIALDIDRLQELDWPPRMRPREDGERGEGFRLAAAARGSAVQRLGMSIYDATPEALGGSFDLTFCGSVLIHLRDPMLALERMAALARGGSLVLAEEYSRKLDLLPLQAAEFRGESPWMTWWRPARRTWVAMVRAAGFEQVEIHGRFSLRPRERRKAIPHVVIHARGPGGPEWD